MHKWTWFTSEWDVLPESLQSAEDEGWEIFSICEIGEMQRFVKVVARKPREQRWTPVISPQPPQRKITRQNATVRNAPRRAKQTQAVRSVTAPASSSRVKTVREVDGTD
jgi:hypothetical protein